MKCRPPIIFITLFILMSYLIPASRANKMRVSSDFSASAKEFVELLAEGQYSSAVVNFDSTMKATFSPHELEETWKSIIAQVGPFKRQVRIRSEKWRQYDLIFVTCEFENFMIDTKVVFDNAGKIAGLWFLPSQLPAEYQPPAYARSELFEEEEVVIGTGEWSLPGTLTFPNGNGPFPAVVLVHGSGPQDRDESVGPNRPFCDLAWGLASRGIAVLRYEKRTKAHNTKFAAIKDSLTVHEETIEDALKAVSLLRRTEGIDDEMIFVLGHSLGGMLIPRIGKLDPAISGFIVLAGPTRPSEDAIIEQMTYLYSLDGTLSESERSQLEEIKKQVARVKAPTLSVTTPSDELPLGLPAKYWLDLRGYNPPEMARDLKQPMLILQGEKDYQVTMEDFHGWGKSLSFRNDIKLKSYPKLNHLFMEGKEKSAPDEYQTPGHIAEVVIQDIAEWIKEQSAQL